MLYTLQLIAEDQENGSTFDNIWTFNYKEQLDHYIFMCSYVHVTQHLTNSGKMNNRQDTESPLS